MRRIVDLAEEMLELLMAVGQVFLVEDCVEPLTLYNTALKTELSELLRSLDATRCAQCNRCRSPPPPREGASNKILGAQTIHSFG